MVKLKIMGIEVTIHNGEVHSENELIALLENCKPLSIIYPASEDNYAALQAVRNLNAVILEPAELVDAVRRQGGTP